MLRNYLKIAFRNILRHKTYSFINVAGLAIGMACCILILLWVNHELSYDKFHENANRIYRLCLDTNIGGSELQAPVSCAPAPLVMVQEFPEVEDAVRVQPLGKVLVETGSKKFYEEYIFYSDNSVFNVFSFPLLQGDPQSALVTAYSIVLTETMAAKYFGDENPIGKTLTINNENEFTITGIMQDVPYNSHLNFNMLCSFETLYAENREYLEIWLEFSYWSYLLLAENTNILALEQKFPELIDQNMGDELGKIGGTLDFFLQPLTDIYLYSKMDYEISTLGDITNVYLFAGIALFVLLIACFNFINLSTARSAIRAREVGIRKTFGAVRGKLIAQFLGESIIYSLLSLIIAVILLEMFVPVFNSMTEGKLDVNLFQTPWLIPGLLGLAVLVGLIAGSYPAFFLSSFKPVKVFKGNLKLGAANSRFRSILVVSQFVISIVLIIGTITIYQQLRYMKTKKLGFNKEQVLVIPTVSDVEDQSKSALKHELASVNGVVNVALTSFIPGEFTSKSVFIPEDFSEDQTQMIAHFYADENFLPVLGVEMHAGRNFSLEFATDTAEAIIINQTAVRKFGWDDPVGKTIKTPDIENGEIIWKPNTVIGVVKDFHLTSLHKEIEPLIIRNICDASMMCLRVSTDQIQHTLDLLQGKWNDIFPQQPFDYYFLDESYDNLYRAEQRLGDIALSFCLLAIFVGCLGLFGLSAFTAEQRTKEIGIRKVLGASVSGMVLMLSKEFTKWVVIANVIAFPIAYFVMRHWLENFAYRIDVGWTTFALAAILALIIAVITVSFQAVKAAVANPINSLRYE